MIDHITIRVKDLHQSKAFYDQVLAVLGMKVVLGSLEKGFIGYGEHEPLFEIGQSNLKRPAHKNVHIAFRVKDKETVASFYKLAISIGAKDNGKPGPRPKYSATYYACFVLDPDDNNIEVCLH